ncbi:hypothetical protein [Rickettsia endosymbiont of Orchestes rusci]|uniref:hypothetical protein n=1 Tax=Rickettsia endosymbiont of Orchestes rusci TaxID=3066250 RepID=UPI00313AB184
MVKPQHDIAVLLKNTQNIAIFDPCNKARSIVAWIPKPSWRGASWRRGHLSINIFLY